MKCTGNIIRSALDNYFVKTHEICYHKKTFEPNQSTHMCAMAMFMHILTNDIRRPQMNKSLKKTMLANKN